MSLSPVVSREGANSGSTSVLDFAHIADALSRSPDHGASLDFTKRSLTVIGEEGAEELANVGIVIQRLALNNNHLAALPLTFSSLTRLRYLNLKNNNFSLFPEVLTLLPSLDTLDISHNKIRALPQDPGTLSNLKVFCISRNKLRQLPHYISKFQRLVIFKADRNPLEWPPKHVTEAGRFAQSAQEMKDFVYTVQRYMQENAKSRAAESVTSPLKGKPLETDLSNSYDSWSHLPTPNELDASVTPHARTFSLDSTYSISSLIEETHGTAEADSSLMSPGPSLKMGLLDAYTPTPLRSPDGYLPSPARSEASSTEDLSIALQSPLHGRNASYAAGQHSSSVSRNEMFNKQSMPDLRTAKLNFAKKTTPPPRPKEDHNIPSPLSLRQDSGSSGSASSHSRIVRPFTREPSRYTNTPPPLTSPPRAVPAMDFERNSYFRRLSRLPTTVISTTLPEPLVCLIDSARSILFALSQVYQAFEHYLVYAADDRLATVFRKVLDPATADIMHLIDSLDRFDAVSKKKLPPPSTCRAVVESCRDIVAVFGKALRVLALQLKVLSDGKDVRYLRHMLMVLYGATAEIAFAWKAVSSQLENIKPLISSQTYHATTPSTSRPIVTDFHLPFPSLQHTRSEPRQQPSPRFPVLRTYTTGQIEDPSTGRTRISRRHAGSFSSKDVELGRSLPSYDDFPIRSSGIATQTPTPRASRRKLTGPSVSASTRPPASPIPSVPSRDDLINSLDGLKMPPIHWGHSRQGSSVSFKLSSPQSSPSIPPKLPPFLEIPTSSKVQVDKEALAAVKGALDVAPAVWESIEELLDSELNAYPESRETLKNATNVTGRLGETLRSLQEGELKDASTLKADAHTFMRAVVQLSNVMKSYAGTLPLDLRSNMVKLTNATEEFAILLHVSSFSSSPSRPSPSPSASTIDFMNSISTSTSRSARANSDSDSPLLSSEALPRSALSHPKYRVPQAVFAR